jgi:outer membrane lipoprotein-sorting protein
MMDKHGFNWEEDLKNPPLGKSSAKEWMKQIDLTKIRKPSFFRRYAPLVASVAAVVLILGGVVMKKDSIWNLFPRDHVQVQGEPKNRAVPNDDQMVHYPPRNKVFENEEQLSEEDKAKAKVIQDMAYAYQNIQTLKGKAEVTYGGIETTTTVDFQISEGKNPASYEVSPDKNGDKSEYTNDNHYMWMRSASGKTNQVYMVGTRIPENEPKMPMVSKAPDGNMSYSLPSDPAGSRMAQDIVAPLRNLGLMTEDLKLWSVKGEETFLGRKAKVIEGKLPSYFAQKMHASSYKLWVDAETHLLLKKQFYNESNTVMDSFEVTSLEINPELDNSIFKIPQEIKDKVSKPMLK